MTAVHPSATTDELALEIATELKPRATLARLVDAAHRVRTRPDLLRSRLQFLASQPDQLAEVARSAYWHVNGFAKVKLVERDDFSVRLHVWPAGKNRLGDREPHSHRWDFASLVVVGSGLSETYFTTTDSSEAGALRHVRYEYGRDDTGERHGKPRLKPRGEVTWLRAEAPQVRGSDTVYSCPRTMIHTVTPAGCDLMATVVLQGPQLAETTAVYRRHLRHSFPRLEEPITPADLGVLLRSVEAALTTRQ